MFMPVDPKGNTLNLQATIASATSANYEGYVPPMPHHPITCNGGLYYDEEGVLSCDHAKCEPSDPRTQASLNHSVAILLLEFAAKL
jgi:hypothetical protein